MDSQSPWLQSLAILVSTSAVHAEARIPPRCHRHHDNRNIRSDCSIRLPARTTSRATRERREKPKKNHFKAEKVPGKSHQTNGRRRLDIGRKKLDFQRSTGEPLEGCSSRP